MIHCPNCGTANRKGSRFCNECGKSLPSTGMRCPMCDTINPVGNVYCQQCNARLVPMSSGPEDEEAEETTSPIKGFSLPTIPLDETAEEEEEEAAEPTGEGEAPPGDWLDDLRGSADEQDEGSEEGEEGEDERAVIAEEEDLEPADIPDWLSELGPVTEGPQAPVDVDAGPEEEGPAPEEVPEGDLLEAASAEEADVTERVPPSAQDIGPSDDEEAPSSEERRPPEPAEIPDWLRELGPAMEETPSPAEDEPPMDQALRTEESEDAPPQQPEAEDRDREEAPAWLRELSLPDEEEKAPRPGPTAAEREPSVDEAEATAIEIPDWLKDVEGGQPPESPEELTTEGDVFAPEEPAEEAQEEEPPPKPVAIPTWLKEAEGEEAPGEETPVPFTEPLPEAMETPDWLTELMKPTPGEEEASPFEAEPGMGEAWETDLERADIPSWVQELRPSQDKDEEPVRGPMETEGLLKGLRGLIPAATIGVPTAFEGPSRAQPSEASLARAELFQSLLGQPAIPPAERPIPEERERKRGFASAVERWLVAAILAFAVLSILLAPVMTGQTPRLTQPLMTSGAAAVRNAVDGLDAGDQVLVAFDYGPPEADELNAAARPVLTHVLERGARLSIVSTRPDGSLMAGAVMADVASSRDQYALIGYRPGAAAAVSQLLAVTDSEPALILVLTSRPMPLRLWIEQAYARYGDGLPLIAVGSAALEPVASPYLDANAGQLRGAIHGYKGAASYEALRGSLGSAAGRLDALAAGHIVIVILIVLGALIHALVRTEGEKP